MIHDVVILYDSTITRYQVPRLPLGPTGNQEPTARIAHRALEPTVGPYVLPGTCIISYQLMYIVLDGTWYSV